MGIWPKFRPLTTSVDFQSTTVLNDKSMRVEKQLLERSPSGYSTPDKWPGKNNLTRAKYTAGSFLTVYFISFFFLIYPLSFTYLYRNVFITPFGFVYTFLPRFLPRALSVRNRQTALYFITTNLKINRISVFLDFQQVFKNRFLCIFRRVLKWQLVCKRSSFIGSL